MALKEVARDLGVIRAEVVRRLIDRGLSQLDAGDLEAGLSAIRESFGAPADNGWVLEQTGGYRDWQLQRMWEL